LNEKLIPSNKRRSKYPIKLGAGKKKLGKTNKLEMNLLSIIPKTPSFVDLPLSFQPTYSYFVILFSFFSLSLSL
jgi:hypothetical protein